MVEAGGKIGEKGCLLNSPLLSLQPCPCSSPSMPCQNQYFHNLLSLILSRLNHHHQQREQKWMEGTMRTKRGSHVNIFFLAHPHPCLPCHKLSLVTLLTLFSKNKMRQWRGRVALPLKNPLVNSHRLCLYERLWGF